MVRSKTKTKGAGSAKVGVGKSCFIWKSSEISITKRHLQQKLEGIKNNNNHANSWGKSIPEERIM